MNKVDIEHISYDYTMFAICAYRINFANIMAQEFNILNTAGFTYARNLILYLKKSIDTSEVDKFLSRIDDQITSLTTNRTSLFCEKLKNKDMLTIYKFFYKHRKELGLDGVSLNVDTYLLQEHSDGDNSKKEI